MKHEAFAVLVCALATISAAGCRVRPMRHTAWTVRFGPVISSEMIVGRASDGANVWLATSTDTLVHLDVSAGRYERHSVSSRAAGEHLWGLASVDGRLWTLLGRDVLAEVGADGAIVRRIALSRPHVGLFGGPRNLLYQVMNFDPPADALSAGPPGDVQRRPWGAMKTRALPLERGAVAALNLVSCGATANGTIACWFPDEAAITLTNERGNSRRIELEGVPTVQRELLLTSESPRKPIRDAFVSSTGEIWVLGSGHPRDRSTSDWAGGWLLATYAPDGQLTRRLELPEPARLVLAADSDSCLVLGWDGHVVEVRP